MTDESSEPSSPDEDETPRRPPDADADRSGEPTPEDADTEPQDAADADTGDHDGDTDSLNDGDGESDSLNDGNGDDGGFEFGITEATTPADASDADTEDAESPDGQTPGDASVDQPTTASGADEPVGLLASTRDRLPYPETDRNVLYALLAMTVASLVLRFISLGARVAHQDEGRVGYWIIRYLESGVWEYRAIVHGPFLFHVNKWVFGFIGPSDFSSRLVVAVIGGLLPLVAWLFRKHLRDTEVIALGVLLALNPVLVYYSRFMRNDVPLAVFMLAALGFAVRYYDERDTRYVYGAVGAFALGMTTKENGLLYAASWLGAAALLLDHRLLYSRLVDTDRGPLRTVLAYGHWLVPVTIRRMPELLRDLIGRRAQASNAADGEADGDDRWIAVHWRTIGVVAVAIVQFFAIIVFFYAPRGGGYMKVGGGGPPDVREETTGEMGLYWAIDDLLGGDPSMFVAVVEEATLGSWQEFTSVWGGHENSYILYFQHYVDVLLAGALVVSGFAILGFLVDRYGTGGPRDLVALAGYWGFVSVLGYPIATDIRAAWATTHAIVPLAIPAAVGLAIVFRWAIDSFTLDDGVGVALAVVVLLGVFGQMGFVLTQDVYLEPQSPDNQLVQYAQPSTDAKPTLERVQQLGLENGGAGDVDVLFWGREIAVENESELAQAPAAGGYYPRRLWMWYMKMYEYEANQSGQHFVYSDTDDGEVLNETRPPVVVTFGQSEGPRIPKDGGQELHDWLLANGYEQVSQQRYGNHPDATSTRPILFYLRVNPNQSTTEPPFSGPQTEPWTRSLRATSDRTRPTTLVAADSSTMQGLPTPPRDWHTLEEPTTASHEAPDRSPIDRRRTTPLLAAARGT